MVFEVVSRKAFAVLASYDMADLARELGLGPTLWVYDVSRMPGGVLFMAAAGYALLRGVHIRADFLYRNWSPRTQATLDAALYLAFYFRANMATYPDIARGIEESGILQLVSPTADNVWGYFLELQIWVCLILCVVVGAGLVAEDRRTNALEMYLSRPLSVWQYVLGKLGIIGFFLALITVLPVCLLIVVQAFLVGFEPGQTAELAGLFWRSIVAGAVFVAFLSVLVTAASALSKRARNASILWVGFLVMVEGLLRGNLQEAFLDPEVHLVSLHCNLARCMAWILDNQVELAQYPDVPVAWSAGILGGWTLLCLTVVLRRVRPVEIVA